MWHIDAPSLEELNNYADKLLPGLKTRIKKCGNSGVIRALLRDEYGQDTEQTLRDLLILPPMQLRDYSDSLMLQIIKGFSYDELSQLLVIKCKNKKDITQDEKFLLDKYSILSELEDLFGYEKYLGRSTRKTFAMVKMSGHNTCVYCNRQYTFAIERNSGKNDNDRIARPALDHWYLKSLFPLMSLSYYNLIPSCTICNSSVKHSELWTLETHVHPYMTSSSDPGFSFRYRPGLSSSWEVYLADFDPDPKVKKTAEALCLQEVYQCHSDLEVADLLELTRRNNWTYLNQVYDIILAKLGGGTDKEKAYRLLLGTEMVADKHKNRPFSKLKRDILEQLKQEEHISYSFD